MRRNQALLTYTKSTTTSIEKAVTRNTQITRTNNIFAHSPDTNKTLYIRTTKYSRKAACVEIQKKIAKTQEQLDP